MSFKPCNFCHVWDSHLANQCREGHCIWHKDYCPLSRDDLGFIDEPQDERELS